MKLKSLEIGDVKWTEGFWADWFGLCHKTMISNMWQLLKDPKISHSYENFLIAAGLREGYHHGHITKQGFRWLRWILTEASHHVAKTQRLAPLYNRVRKKHGKNSAKI